MNLFSSATDCLSMIIKAAYCAIIEDFPSIVSIIASDVLRIGAKLDFFLKSLETLAALISAFSSSSVLKQVANGRRINVITPMPKNILIPLTSM